ncbi:hypothetical protein HOR67_gp36 [Ralstonia phage RS-PI-1]|uniref:Uncharacterized protein n=1 Tax=Ralstonia phage RS-PI-1 TaxID=1958965 RepID=A0A1S6L1E5_9CAUD|nr:hypothetical protein HOR67_gp36 [Ralstonia phage RS-PI-1]AQT27798.1 hypothetical protein [Ralstonia phage RS-PI-1]
MTSLSELYEDAGVEPDFTPVDTVFNQVGVGIAVGFAMMEQDDE